MYGFYDAHQARDHGNAQYDQSDFDLVYSGGYFERRVNTALDYSYYSVAYDQFPGATNFPDGNGGFLDPTQSIFATEHYTKFTQEARLSSPTDNRFRVIAGLFYQRQTNKDNTDFSVQDLSKIVIQPRWLWRVLRRKKAPGSGRII